MGTQTATHAGLWKDWEKTGKAEFLKVCKSHFCRTETTEASSQQPSIVTIGKLVEELLEEIISNRLKKESVVSFLKETVSHFPLLRDVLVDAVTVVESNAGTKDQKNRLIGLMSQLQQIFGDGDRLLKERLDMESLQDLGVIKGNAFNTKLIKVKTRLFYKQQKFNLLREESEGYAKLIAELNQDFSDMSAEQLLEIIKSLIGCFNLDPNRVLDVILECFESRPSEGEDIFVPLLKAFSYEQSTLAEVLGSKFVNAACGGDASLVSSDEQGSSNTPKSLYILAALLLHHGLVQLEELLKWLIPSDQKIEADAARDMASAMEAYRRTQVVTLKKEGIPTEEEEKAAEENRIERASSNQKLCLLEALLTVGDAVLSLELMSRFPDGYPATFPDIARSMARLTHAVVTPFYRECYSLPSAYFNRDEPSESLLYTSTLSHQFEGESNSKCGSLQYLEASFLLDVNPSRSFEDLAATAFPLISSLGPYISIDVPLLYKLIRIMSAYLQKFPFEFSPAAAAKPSNGVQFEILTLLDSVVLPSLSLLDANCGVAEEVWNVCRNFPYHVRYHLYGSWKNVTWCHHPVLARKKAEHVKVIKAVMKRISKENVKPLGRTIGKLALSSPGLIFDYILTQVQLYDNMIIPVTDTLKYLTNLSYDILGYCIIEALSNPERDRTKHDGTTISLWLQSLATLCAHLNKKYQNMELTGILQYVANQLKAQKSLDLILMKELVTKMGGIEATDEMTDEQLFALAGGELLRQEAGSFAQMRNLKKSSTRLRDSLCNSNLAIPLCLLMAQQRACVIHRETAEQSHLKLVGKLFDQCQDTLVQLGTFLSLSMNTEEYISRIPALGELLSDFHIEADTAFFLARPKYWNSINLQFTAFQSSKGYLALNEIEKKEKFCSIMSEVLNPLQEDVQRIHSPKIWQEISPALFVAFWTLSLHELVVPSDVYEKEMDKLKQQMREIEEKKELPSIKRRKEVDRCQNTFDKLRDEMKRQKEHIERVLAYMESEKERWFPPRQTKNEAVTNVLQLCIFPRTLYTNVDAIYCARFIQMLHNLRTANFSSLICLDKIFCDISYTVTGCTENEAHRYGRFLHEILAMCSHWHTDKLVYEKECGNHPGFVTRVRGPSIPSTQGDKPVELTYEAYVQVAHKWHYKLTKALVVCLESKDYVSIRNSMIVLKRILPHFPTIESLGNIIERRISAVQQQEKDTRQDLYTLATSYKGLLQSQKKRMKPDTDYQKRWMKATGQAVPPSGTPGSTKMGAGGADGGSRTASAASADKRKTVSSSIPSTPVVSSASDNAEAGSNGLKEKRLRSDKKKKEKVGESGEVSPGSDPSPLTKKRQLPQKDLIIPRSKQDGGSVADGALDEKRRRTDHPKTPVQGSSEEGEVSSSANEKRKGKLKKGEKRERIRPPSSSPPQFRAGSPPSQPDVTKRRREERFRASPPRGAVPGEPWHGNGAPGVNSPIRGGPPAPMDEYFAFREREEREMARGREKERDRDLYRERDSFERAMKDHWDRSPDRSRDRMKDKHASRRPGMERDKW